MGLSLVTNPLIALNMSPEDYAITGYFASFSTLISPLVVFYMLHYYNKRYFELDEDGRLKLRALLFKGLIFFSTFVSIVCLGLLIGYIKIFKSALQFPIFPYCYLTVLAIPLAGIYQLKLTDLRMSRNSSAFFRWSVGVGVLLVATNLILIVACKWGALGKCLAPFITNLLVFIVLLKQNWGLFRVQTTWKDFKNVLKFCLPLALGAMLGYFSNGLDRTYLESLGNTTEYGYYIVGWQIATYLTVFSTAISSTFQPDIYEATIKKDNRKLIQTCCVQLGLLSFVVLLFISLCPFLIDILTAGRYVASTPYARIISISTLTSGIYYIINNYTIAKGKSQLYLYTTVIGSVAIVLLMPYMVEHFKYYGGGLMVSFSFVIFAVINVILYPLCNHRRNK